MDRVLPSDIQEAENKASLERQKKTRERRSKEKAAKDKYKAGKAALERAGVFSTKASRELKKQYEDALADIDTDLKSNLTNKDQNIDNDSIDTVGDLSDQMIEVVLCVDGEPYDASITGTIGEKLYP